MPGVHGRPRSGAGVEEVGCEVTVITRATAMFTVRWRRVLLKVNAVDPVSGALTIVGAGDCERHGHGAVHRGGPRWRWTWWGRRRRRTRGRHGDDRRDGGPGGSDAERVPIQLQYGDVRRYRAGGDDALRRARGAELFGPAAGGVHGRPRQRRVDDRGGGGLRGHGHGGGHARLRGRHGDDRRDGGPGGSDAERVPIQLQYGDVRRYRADGDDALRRAGGAELFGPAARRCARSTPSAAR